jgi:hypothetical protein
MTGPYHAILHTRRELQAAIGKAFGPDGTEEQRYAICAVVHTHDLMRTHKVHCIICDSEIAHRPAYMALVCNTSARGWGAGVICRRCGNRHNRLELTELAAQHAHLTFAPPQGSA